MPNPLFMSSLGLVVSTLAAGCVTATDPVQMNLVASTSGLPESVTEVAFNPGGAGAMRAYITGYSFWDNTPPGSAAIAKPVIHRQAGGSGTYQDPVTVAVGHSITGGRSRMDFPAGTRFYFPHLRKYGIVEDVCGDGPRPQDGPCHIGYNGMPWLDIYVGGRNVSTAEANRCMYSITGVRDVMLSPPPGLPVHAGEITHTNCASGA